MFNNTIVGAIMLLTLHKSHLLIVLNKSSSPNPITFIATVYLCCFFVFAVVNVNKKCIAESIVFFFCLLLSDNRVSD